MIVTSCHITGTSCYLCRSRLFYFIQHMPLPKRSLFGLFHCNVGHSSKSERSSRTITSHYMIANNALGFALTLLNIYVSRHEEQEALLTPTADDQHQLLPVPPVRIPVILTIPLFMRTRKRVKLSSGGSGENKSQGKSVRFVCVRSTS
jgi:hypothetical protein